MVNAFNNGTILLNYIGHGNPDVWAHEFIFERSSTIPQLSNSVYPFLTAATKIMGSATTVMVFCFNYIINLM